MSRVQVLPLTSNITRVYPCEALVTVHNKQGKVLADQITTVDKSRLGEFIGALNTAEMQTVNTIIKLQLDL